MANTMTIKENYEAVLEVLKEAGETDLADFIQGRIDQENKARENAKAKRLEKTGGQKKDPAMSDIYVALREKLYKVLTTAFQTGDELVAKAKAVTSKGTPVPAMQVAMALRPLIEDGTLVKGEVKVETTGKDGLKKETMRTAYKLA